MKKIFTLMITAVFVSAAFAQQRTYDQNDHKYDKRKDIVIKDNRNNNGNNRFDKNAYINRQLENEINRINQEYERKIQDVQRKPFMNRNKKSRLIAQLENQRKEELRKVYARFNNKRGQSYDNWSNSRS